MTWTLSDEENLLGSLQTTSTTQANNYVLSQNQLQTPEYVAGQNAGQSVTNITNNIASGLSKDLSGIANWFSEYWIWILVGIIGVIILFMLIKSRR